MFVTTSDESCERHQKHAGVTLLWSRVELVHSSCTSEAQPAVSAVAFMCMRSHPGSSAQPCCPRFSHFKYLLEVSAWSATGVLKRYNTASRAVLLHDHHGWTWPQDSTSSRA